MPVDWRFRYSVIKILAKDNKQSSIKLYWKKRRVFLKITYVVNVFRANQLAGQECYLSIVPKTLQQPFCRALSTAAFIEKYLSTIST